MLLFFFMKSFVKQQKRYNELKPIFWKRYQVKFEKCIVLFAYMPLSFLRLYLNSYLCSILTELTLHCILH